MNRDVKIALCTLALMTGGFAIQSTESAHAAQATEAVSISAPEDGIVTKAYVKSIKDAGVSIQSVIDQYADKIVQIGFRALEFCDEELDLSKAINLKSISNDAFFKTNLKAINLSNVTHIGEFAFAGCKTLKNVELGNINRISRGAFMGCAGLENIVLPESVKEIGIAAFAGAGLKSIRLPANVERVDANAFGGCRNMVHAVIENPSIDITDNVFDKQYVPWAVRYTGQTSQDNYYFILGAQENWHIYDAILRPYGLSWLPVTVFCDNQKIGDPLTEIDGFKLITSTLEGQIVTIDLNGIQEPVIGFVKNDNGELLANSEGTLVLAPKGVTHIDYVGALSDNVKTVVIPDSVVRIYGNLPVRYGSKVDYVISNSLKFDDRVSYSGIGTIYTNNQTVIDTLTKNFDDDMVKPLTVTHHLMLSDDVELHTLWAELAQLRARDSGHLALDEASVLFDDSAFLNSSRAAHDKLVNNRELKNKLREEIEKLREVK